MLVLLAGGRTRKDFAQQFRRTPVRLVPHEIHAPPGHTQTQEPESYTVTRQFGIFSS